MIHKICISLLCIALSIAPVYAQSRTETEYPTMAALEQTSLPERDRVDLAKRFLGIHDVLPPPDSPPTYQLGDQRTFWASNLVNDSTFQVNATLRAVSQHIYLWVETGAPVSDADVQALAEAFDAHVYNAVRELWGSEDSPGIDGDPRIYGLFTSNVGGAVAAYFASVNTYPAAVVPTSNEHEMFIFNLDTIIANIPNLASVTAHEFQHMIRSHVDGNEDTWMDEGASTFTELYLGYDSPVGHTLSFLDAPHTQLNTWSENGPRAPHYGAAFMFLTYFYERYGLAALQKLSADPANGLTSVDNILRDMGEPGVNTFFADWVVANYVFDPDLGDGRYGYNLLWDYLRRPAVRATIENYPAANMGIVSQYATDYYVLNGLRGKSQLTVQIDMPTTVQLIPAPPLKGRWMWYSNRGDESDTTLTHAFDLTGVESATLRYKTWYHTERFWDYAYVLVSTDGGATWQPLATPGTTLEDPHHNGYGPGYTGESGGWLEESIPLDAYAGQNILLRFEMITDDAVTQPGIVIDDVEIPEIGYFSDFEVDGGGWEAVGWIRTDNTLPQNAWIQVIQQGEDGVSLSRWQANQGQGWILLLDETVDEVVLAVSPFAPVTTVPMPYTLHITAS